MSRLLVLALALTACHRPQASGQVVPPRDVLDPAIAWKSEPLVLVCSTAPVTRDEVQHSLDLWAEFGAPPLSAVESHCLGNVPTGYVHVDLRPAGMDWPEKALAATVVSSDYSQPRDYALIYLTSGDMRVLHHEVGHIWLDHADPRVAPHWLAPSIDNFSWDGWTGVQKAFREGGY